MIDVIFCLSSKAHKKSEPSNWQCPITNFFRMSKVTKVMIVPIELKKRKILS